MENGIFYVSHSLILYRLPALAIYLNVCGSESNTKEEESMTVWKWVYRVPKSISLPLM